MNLGDRDRIRAEIRVHLDGHGGPGLVVPMTCLLDRQEHALRLAAGAAHGSPAASRSPPVSLRGRYADRGDEKDLDLRLDKSRKHVTIYRMMRECA